MSFHNFAHIKSLFVTFEYIIIINYIKLLLNYVIAYLKSSQKKRRKGRKKREKMSKKNKNKIIEERPDYRKGEKIDF